jgi:hypothetical protein
MSLLHFSVLSKTFNSGNQKSNYFFLFQLYEIDDNPKRKEFLDELFAFMQKRGELLYQKYIY